VEALKELFKKHKFRRFDIVRELDCGEDYFKRILADAPYRVEATMSDRIVERNAKIRQAWADALREVIFGRSEEDWIEIFHRNRGHLGNIATEIGMQRNDIGAILRRATEIGEDVFAMLDNARLQAIDGLNEDLQDKAVKTALSDDPKWATRANLEILRMGGIGDDGKIRDRRNDGMISGQTVNIQMNMLPSDSDIEEQRRMIGAASKAQKLLGPELQRRRDYEGRTGATEQDASEEIEGPLMELDD